MKKITLLITILLITCYSWHGNAQATCASPASVTVVADCSAATPYTIDYATAADLGTTDLSCDTFGTNTGAWLEFTAPATGGVTVSFTDTNEYALFDSCGGTQIICVSTAANSGNIAGLTSGSTYKLAVWKDSATSGTTDVCLQEYTPPPPPANDDCSVAIALTVNVDLNCTTVTAGTTVGATASAEADDVTGTPNTDVWFSFVATGAEHTVVISDVVNQGGGTSTSTDMGMGVYDATGGCAGLAYVDTSDPNTLSLTGLTASTTYYIRAYGWSTSVQYNNFNICVGTPPPPPPPPANDDCSGAITLTVNTDFSCGTVTAGTTAGATASAEADDVSGTPNTDVWYSFTATDAAHRVEISNVVNQGGGTSTSTDMGMGVYDATGGCAGLAFVGTSDPNTLNLTGLTVSTVYYVRVYGWSTSIQYNNFNICVGTPPPPPANDDCSGAIPLTPGNAFASNPIDGSVASATSGADPVAGCGSDGPGTWYSVVVPADGIITIETGPDAATGDTGFDSLIEAFSGTCGALTSIECDDDDAAANLFSILELTGLTPNSTIFVRVWESGGNDDEPFSISAYNASLSIEDNKIDGFSMYPNPVNDILRFNALDAIESVSIYNLLGQEVLSTQPRVSNTEVDMTNLPTGMYVVKVLIGEQLGSYKIIKE